MVFSMCPLSKTQLYSETACITEWQSERVCEYISMYIRRCKEVCQSRNRGSIPRKGKLKAEGRYPVCARGTGMVGGRVQNAKNAPMANERRERTEKERRRCTNKSKRANEKKVKYDEERRWPIGELVIKMDWRGVSALPLVPLYTTA